MAKMNKFKRVCADTNVLIGLALLAERGERTFISANIAGKSNRYANKQYAEDIKALQNFIDAKSIELVLPPQVMYELQYREKEFDENGNKVDLTKEAIALQNLKDLTLEYLKKHPGIKVARILPNRKEQFFKNSEMLANEYVNTYHIFEPNNMGNVPSDATIIAQVTSLGLDFLTRDQHFHSKHYLSSKSKAEKIAISNKNLGNQYPTKILNFQDLQSEFINKTAYGDIRKKKYFNDNTPIANCTYMDYNEYLEDRALERKNHMAWIQKHTSPTQDK